MSGNNDKVIQSSADNFGDLKAWFTASQLNLETNVKAHMDSQLNVLSAKLEATKIVADDAFELSKLNVRVVIDG